MSDDRQDDHGFSLIDVLVATSIMSVIMVMATGAVLEIYSNVNRTEGITFAREQIGNSFRRLDKELRYASWVSTPGQVNGGWYLEWATSSDDCRQLVFKDRVLIQKTWKMVAGAVPGSPTTIATDLVPTGSTAPFTLYQPGDRPYASATPNSSGVGANYELEHAQVRLRFTGRIGTTSLPLDVLFTARNTNRNTSTLSDCSKGRPT
ncbi:type II secretion system protein [Actinoplanes sp. NPDC049802]|uniref:PulJ/GspJ family protein n=1 Tax=Actinoplanes sp. NPDC049802 TaxID=3154742 RepID=UPI0033D9251A